MKKFIAFLIIVAIAFLLGNYFYLNSDAYVLKRAEKNLSKINQISEKEKAEIAVSLRNISWKVKIRNESLLFAYDPWYYFLSANDDVADYQENCFGKEASNYCIKVIERHDRHLNSAIKNIDFIKNTGVNFYDQVIQEKLKRPPTTNELSDGHDLVVFKRGVLNYAPISGWKFIGPPINIDHVDKVIQ